MNNIDFYRNLVDIMASGSNKSSGPKFINNEAITPRTLGAGYTPLLPNEDDAAINFGNGQTGNEGPSTDNALPKEDNRVTPEFFYKALMNGLAETVKNNFKDLFPQIEILGDEFMEEFCNNAITENGTPLAENMITTIKNQVSGALSSFASNYVKTHKEKESLDMEEVAKDFNDFITAKLNDFSQKQVAAGEAIDEIKNPDKNNLEDLGKIIEKANENNYITTAETKEIKDTAGKFLLSSLVKGSQDATDFLKAIKSTYATNPNYTKAMTAIKNAQRYEEAGDYINAQASYKDAQTLLNTFLSTIPASDIAKTTNALITAKIPPEVPEVPEVPDTPDAPQGPAKPLDDTAAYTKTLTDLANDAKKAYDAMPEGPDKVAAKVLLDTVTKYKDQALEALKGADAAKTDAQKSALNNTLDGLKTLVSNFASQITGTTTTPEWTREDAKIAINKIYTDAKALYDSMPEGSAKKAAKSYLDMIENAKNSAEIELLTISKDVKGESAEAAKVRKAAETAALKAKIDGYSNFMTDMAAQIKALAAPGTTPPPTPTVESAIKDAKADPTVTKVKADCDQFVVNYNNLTDTQKAQLKPEFDAVTAILANYNKFDNNSLKTIDEVNANKAAITAKAAEAAAALGKSAAPGTTPPPGPGIDTPTVDSTITAVKADPVVTKVKADCDQFMIDYNKLTDAQKAQLKPEFDAVTAILANYNKFDDKSLKTIDEVNANKSAITAKAAEAAAALVKSGNAVKENDGTTAIQTATTAALNDPAVVTAFNNANEFITQYNALKPEQQAQFKAAFDSAQNVITDYNKLKNNTCTSLEDVSATKEAITNPSATLFEAAKSAKALVDANTAETADKAAIKAASDLALKDPNVNVSVNYAKEFITLYNSLKPEQKEQFKDAFANAQQMVTNYDKLKNNTCTSTTDVTNTTKAITGDLSIMETNVGNIKAVLAANATAADKAAIKAASDLALQDPNVKVSVDYANQFITLYNSLKPEQKAQFQAAFAKAQQIVTNHDKLKNNTCTSTTDVANTKAGITGDLSIMETNISNVKAVVDANAAADVAAAVKNACIAALADKAVSGVIEDAAAFVSAYNKLSGATKAQLKSKFDNAMVILGNATSLQTNLPKSVDEVNRIKTAIIAQASTIKSDRITAERFVSENALAAEINAAITEFNKDPLVKQAREDIVKLMNQWNDLTEAQKKDPKAVAANELMRIVSDILNKTGAGIFKNAEEVKELQKTMQGLAPQIKNAITDLDAIKNTPSIDPAIKKAIDTAKITGKPIFQTAQTHVDNFMTEYNKLSDKQKNTPEVKNAYAKIEEIKLHLKKMDDYDYATTNDVANGITIIFNGSIAGPNLIKTVTNVLADGQIDPAVRAACDEYKVTKKAELQKARDNINDFMTAYNKLSSAQKNQTTVKKAYDEIQKAIAELGKFDSYHYEKITDVIVSFAIIVGGASTVNVKLVTNLLTPPKPPATPGGPGRPQEVPAER